VVVNGLMNASVGVGGFCAVHCPSRDRIGVEGDIASDHGSRMVLDDARSGRLDAQSADATFDRFDLAKAPVG